MSGEILRLKPDEVARLFAEGKMETVEVFDLERLRGPNSTLQLITLVEDFLKSGNRFSDSELVPGIICLQKWASTIDKEVVQTASTTYPSNRVSLEQMVGEMIHKGAISDNLGLSPCEFLNGNKFYDKRSIFMAITREQQWGALKVLFDINTSNLMSNAGHDDKNYSLHLSENLPLKDVHEQMFQLIDQAVGKKGYLLEDITTPAQIRGIGIDPGTHPVKAHIAPSVIDGVSVIIVTGHTGVTDMEKYGRVFGPSAVDGNPNIDEISLKFSPSFIASVRPLAEDEYRKYVPK